MWLAEGEALFQVDGTNLWREVIVLREIGLRRGWVGQDVGGLCGWGVRPLVVVVRRVGGGRRGERRVGVQKVSMDVGVV